MMGCILVYVSLTGTAFTFLELVDKFTNNLTVKTCAFNVVYCDVSTLRFIFDFFVTLGLAGLFYKLLCPLLPKIGLETVLITGINI